MFSTLLDTIQHAYGWDDETVFNLTLRRAIQIKESIAQREEIRRWESLKTLEWQTQNLAMMIANTVESDKAREQLVNHAAKLSLTRSSADTKTGNKPKKRKTYKLLDGTEISARELSNYTYDEIDHTDENKELTERARAANAGKNIGNVMGAFTRG